MSKDPRLSLQTLRVLNAFYEQPKVALSGSDIFLKTKMFSGTLYPILYRLEKAGWLTAKWETLDPREAGRPRRRLYRITGTGLLRTRLALAELGADTQRG